MLILVVGSRPDLIKVGPIAAELRATRTPFRVVNSGQHTELQRGTPAESDLAGAQHLGLASDGNVMRWISLAIKRLTPVLADASIVAVQGDTMTALAAAHAAPSEALLVHIEAGVRSHNLAEPWPEEGFRRDIDGLADWYYAPTSTAYANLLAEGHPAERIRVTGNSIVSALARYTNAKPSPASDHVLVTLHRREWMGGPHFIEVLDALDTVARQTPARFLWPVHPAVAQRFPPGWVAHVPANLCLIPPLLYADAASLVATALGVLSDSGGLIEEAATLGVPSVQLRNVSDRPEAIEAGVSWLEPPTAAGVAAGVHRLMKCNVPRRASALYGDVTAASQIAQHLAALDTVPVSE